MAPELGEFALSGLLPAVGIAGFAVGYYFSLAPLIKENREVVEDGLRDLAEESERNISNRQLRSWGKEVYWSYIYISIHKKLIKLMMVGSGSWILSYVDSLFPGDSLKILEISPLGLRNVIVLRFLAIFAWCVGLSMMISIVYNFHTEVFKNFSTKKREMESSIRDTFGDEQRFVNGGQRQEDDSPEENES